MSLLSDHHPLHRLRGRGSVPRVPRALRESEDLALLTQADDLRQMRARGGYTGVGGLMLYLGSSPPYEGDGSLESRWEINLGVLPRPGQPGWIWACSSSAMSDSPVLLCASLELDEVIDAFNAQDRRLRRQGLHRWADVSSRDTLYGPIQREQVIELLRRAPRLRPQFDTSRWMRDDPPGP